jgi:hypothetical protein
MSILKLIIRQFQKSTFQLIFGILILSSCLGKQGVYYSEMSKIPEIITYDNGFYILTGNSNKNSALLIYRIKIQINTSQKKIELRGYQAVNVKFKERFKFKVKNISKKELDGYEFYWIDPDRKYNSLTIKNK